MSTEGYISLGLGITSIFLAIGINWYRNLQEDKRRKENERFFVKQIQNNLKKMAQYFLDVETETKRNEDASHNNDVMMMALKTFYLRNDQEMKDVLYQTKLYLPFWNTLSTEDKNDLNNILDVFSWLLYDYYPLSLPESMREITVTNSRKVFLEKKDYVMNTSHRLLEKV
jgi:hypothetical protein